MGLKFFGFGTFVIKDASILSDFFIDSGDVVGVPFCYYVYD